MGAGCMFVQDIAIACMQFCHLYVYTIHGIYEMKESSDHEFIVEVYTVVLASMPDSVLEVSILKINTYFYCTIIS